MVEERKKKTNFAPEIENQNTRVLIPSFGIPFRITCSGEAAGQLHNPLQESVPSNIRATFDGITTVGVARTLFQTIIKSDNFLINYSYSSIKSNLFVC